MNPEIAVNDARVVLKVKKKKNVLLFSTFRKEFLEKVERSKGIYKAICSYSVLTKTDIIHNFNDVCHYRIKQPNGVRGILLDLTRVFHDLNNPKTQYKQWVKYSQYIMRESPWAPMFRTKTLRTGFKSGITMNVNQPISAIAGACIALRNGTECQVRLPMFNLMLSRGFNGHIAYLMSMAYRYSPDNKEFYSVSFGDGHDPITESHNLKDIIRFFKEGYKFPKEAKPATKYSKDYSVFNYVGASYTGRDEEIGDWIRINTKVTKIGNGWDAKKIVTEDEIMRIANEFNKMINEQEPVK